MRYVHLTILITSLIVTTLAASAAAHYRAHSSHSHLNRRVAVPTPTSRLRQPLDLSAVFPDSSFTMGIGGAVLVDPGVHGLDQRLHQGLGMDMNLGVRLGQPISLHLATLATFHPDPQAAEGSDPGLLTEVSFDIRAYVNPNARFIEPFIQLGTGISEIVRAGSSSDTEVGASLHAGFGIHVPLHQNLAVTATALYRPTLLSATAPQDHSALPHLLTGSVGLTLRL